MEPAQRADRREQKKDRDNCRRAFRIFLSRLRICDARREKRGEEVENSSPSWEEALGLWLALKERTEI